MGLSLTNFMLDEAMSDTRIRPILTENAWGNVGFVTHPKFAVNKKLIISK